MPKGTLTLCDLKQIRKGSTNIGGELAQTPILALDENIHLIVFYGWPCHSHPRWPRLCRCSLGPPFIRILLFSTYASPFLPSSPPPFFIIASLL